jgi:hypothetical protein
MRVQGPGTIEFKQILLVESFKLVPRPLDVGPRPKSGKLRLNLHGTCFGGKINWFRPKKQCSKESSWFGEPRIRLGTKVQSNSRIQFASNQSKLVPRKLDPRLLSKVGLRMDIGKWSCFFHQKLPNCQDEGKEGCLMHLIKSGTRLL